MAKIVAVPVLMFGFGFALVPLYDIYCDITGQNGKTGRIEVSAIGDANADVSRTIQVRFLARTNTGLPWSFEPLVETMEIHPGQLYEATFRVRSSSDKPTQGQAVPSVSPSLAAKHFNKTECFCFTRQTLEARETREMPLRFIVDKGIGDEVDAITLSYTFFSLEQQG